MTIQSTSVLNEIVAVQINVSQWTGRKKLADNDLSLNGEVPPKEIINLGSKHTTDPKALKVFNTLKRRMERTCLNVGIPFLGGYAVPVGKADELAKKLAKIVAQFEHEKAAYLLKHESIQQDWIKRFPQYETILVKALTPTSDVEKRISASFSMFKVQSAQSAVSVDAGLANQVDSLTETLDADILKSASKLLDSLTGAIQPNQTNVASLRKLREKVEGLAFLNGRFSKLVSKIKQVEASMPIAGKLNTDEVHRLSGLLYRMSDEAKLKALMSSLEDESNPQPIENEQALLGANENILSEDDFEFDFGEESEADNPLGDMEIEFDFGATQINEERQPKQQSTFF
ncbi:DUF3150 domain-containing protein [Vibrio sp. V27_P1S3P104]|uniref:DUF3150 domain-containing protein n=1 Tax=unclassified Vibrio TaxID=2614977 RepID=UPI00137273D6|nr:MULTISPECIES: DUF3150 domain-containing protein [unclassified Vibrio]NAX34101.1 DUF3150 domain-containing protein [Vibrio sp. V29_P1S30P107]NAX36000.1 DUF3150 domain-containing protein [Vibrio sp. V27_P1S3P104]